MACVRIRDLRDRQNSQTIEVRVLRKWISKGKKEELCYQFVDGHINAIEAVADVKHIEHFDSLIKLQLCYKVSNYICTGTRTYMATIEHVASLVIGQKAEFEHVPDSAIPYIYFNFATFDTIKRRIRDTKLLTELHTGRDVEVTLWPEKSDIVGDDVVPGDIVAIASTVVTEHIGRVQLESTYLTTATINPDMPQTIEHVTRLRGLPEVQVTETVDKTLTILDLKLQSQQKGQTPGNFICEAKITRIHEDRGWYYVLCSKCSNKLYPVYPKKDSDGLIFVCKDDDDITPNFRYCVNTTITDATGSADAVFFNDNMQEMLNISCMEMVTKHADKINPKIVPQQLRSAVDKPRKLHLTLKNDGKIVVNNVSNTASATAIQTGEGTSTFTPTTPIPKSVTSKRTLTETPGNDKK
ncbi:hypothetical protein CASFOL_009341 [Castilleja foliolosa]|uniref:Replication factor A C-terminal domain-containing protein n=1 Tax=Castilleja foliolosa TaxID=1961234 RepID=A0ABD3DXK6_9LAMI